MGRRKKHSSLQRSLLQRLKKSQTSHGITSTWPLLLSVSGKAPIPTVTSTLNKCSIQTNAFLLVTRVYSLQGNREGKKHNTDWEQVHSHIRSSASMKINNTALIQSLLHIVYTNKSSIPSTTAWEAIFLCLEGMLWLKQWGACLNTLGRTSTLY